MDERTHQRQRAYSHFSCLCSSFQKKTVPRPHTNTLPNRNVVYFVSYAFLPLHSLVPPPMDAHVLCLAGTVGLISISVEITSKVTISVNVGFFISFSDDIFGFYFINGFNNSRILNKIRVPSSILISI